MQLQYLAMRDALGPFPFNYNDCNSAVSHGRQDRRQPAGHQDFIAIFTRPLGPLWA